MTDVSTALPQSHRRRVLMSRLGSVLKVMCWKQNRQLHSIETNTANSVGYLQDLQTVIPLPSSYHSTTSSLSLGKFIDIFCDGNLKALIISGEPSPFDLADAWEAILNQYVDIIGSTESKHLIMLQRQVLLLKAKISLVDTAVKVLSERWSQVTADELMKLGYKVNEKTLERDLIMVIDRSKKFIVELDMKAKDFEKMNKTVSTKQKDRSDFEREIARISHYMRFRIDKNQVTVSEYASYYSEYVNAQENGTRKD